MSLPHMSGKVISNINIEQVYLNLLDEDLPEDNYTNHNYVEPAEFSGGISLRNELNDILEEISIEIDSRDEVSRKGKHLVVFKEHLEWFVMSLVANFFGRKYTVIQLQDCHYRNGSYLNMIGLRYTPIRVISEALIELRYVEKLNYTNNPKTPKSTRLWPSKKLLDKVYKFNYLLTYRFNPPFVKLNKPIDKDWVDTFREVLIDENHNDVRDMKIINDFLYQHEWANKGPLRLIYNVDAFHGGRLYTPFQNLRSRKVKERINTLIDGERICEVDYNANHLRLSLAIFSQQDAGDTPYEDIAKLCGETRSEIKMFITRCMGAETKDSVLRSLIKDFESWDRKRFEKVLNAVHQRYPSLHMFGSVGVKLQSVEGSIIRKVILKGAHDKVVCLPIHDAIACKQSDLEWVVRVMKTMWREEVKGLASPRIKILTSD